MYSHPQIEVLRDKLHVKHDFVLFLSSFSPNLIFDIRFCVGIIKTILSLPSALPLSIT